MKSCHVHALVNWPGRSFYFDSCPRPGQLARKILHRDLKSCPRPGQLAREILHRDLKSCHVHALVNWPGRSFYFESCPRPGQLAREILHRDLKSCPRPGELAREILHRDLKSCPRSGQLAREILHMDVKSDRGRNLTLAWRNLTLICLDRCGGKNIYFLPFLLAAR